MPNLSCTVVCLVRNEAPYLLEWIAWYRLIGADQLLIYDNASTDGGTDMLAALHTCNHVTHVPWPDQPGQGPQLLAYTDALARCRTEWIAFLDADEFLVLPRHSNIQSFLDAFPLSCEAIAVNQRVIGSNRRTRFEPGLVSERFPRGSSEKLWLNGWVKTIARTRAVDRPGIHTPVLKGGNMLTAEGLPTVLEDHQRSFPVSHRTAYYNHYIIKSVEEYEHKRARGGGSYAPGAANRGSKYTEAFFRAHDIAEELDATVTRLLPVLRTEHERLIGLAHGVNPGRQ
jgi:hypothetical protein